MTTQTLPAAAKGEASRAKLWAGFIVLIAAAIAFAWWGAGSLRPQISATGLEFREVKAGTGEPIGEADAALMDYALTADDGSVIDSSAAHGGPQPFTAAQVFPGFAEAMARMKEGGEYRFSMPQSLAWGEAGAPPGFPAGSKLNFDVRVGKVVRGGAAMMQQMQQQQQQQQSAPPEGSPEPR